MSRFRPPLVPDRGWLDRLARDALGEPLDGVARVERPGAVNTVLVLSAAGGQSVLRLNGAAELPRFEKEAWCLARTAAAGVPGPSLLGLGERDGLAWMLESLVPGVSADTLPPPERPAAWRQIGAHLAKVHAVPVGGFGDDLARMRSGGLAGWQRYLGYGLASLGRGDPLRALGLLTPEVSAALQASFERLSELQPRLGLSHGDLSLRNAISAPDGAVSLIDWGCAEGHVAPHWDIGLVTGSIMPESCPSFTAFLEGYGLAPAAYAAIRPDIERLRLLEALDKVRWARDRSPADLPRLAARLARALRRLPPPR